MKRWIYLLLVLVMVVSLTMAVSANADLTKLGQTELNSIIEDIDAEIERHHELDSVSQDAVLAAVEKETKSYFSKQGIEISWAWIDYTYTRDWDFYTLTTHIDYKDSEGNSQKPDVYSEVLYENGSYNVYYLLIGTEPVLDKRNDLPEKNWTSTPESAINKASGLDFAVMTQQELAELRQQAENELSNNHQPDSKISNLVDSLAESVVDAYFDKQDAEVSWPWFDYTYTCDWDFYTYRTPVTIRREDGEDQKREVYAEAYPLEGQYALTYLSVGEEVLIDRRSEVPESLYSEIEEKSDMTEAPVSTEMIESTETLMSADILQSTEAPASTETPASVDTPKSTKTSESTETPAPVHIEIGTKGEEVRALQQRLIALGYLEGSADGTFGEQTQSAVKALQNSHELEANGIVTEKEMTAIQEDMQEQAERAIVVAMTNCHSTDVFAPDGNTYDISKFHNYAYTAGVHAEVRKKGKWTQNGTDSWHIKKMRLQLVGTDDMYMNLTLDVSFNGENYVLSGVTETFGSSAHLDSGDTDFLSIEKMEPSERSPFLTVSPAMLGDDVTEETVATEETPSYYDDQERTDWINSQFSPWTGAHKELEDLIKDSLNDERSYKHIETSYTDIIDETVCDQINDFLSNVGYSQRVETGDLFIMTEFSAKNMFNATIKNIAFGIASYQDNTITLIGIE